MLTDLKAPRSMLTDRLAKLVDHGILKRQPYQEPGRRTRYAYVLTNAGLELGTLLIALSEWGEIHILDQHSAVEIIDRNTYQKLRAVLVNEDSEIVPINQVKIALRK